MSKNAKTPLVARSVPATLLFMCALVSSCQGKDDRVEQATSPAAATSSAYRGSSHATQDLLKAIAARDLDATVKSINEIKGLVEPGDTVPFLQRIWRGDEPQDGALREFVRQPRVRLELADALLQASKNGTPDLTPADYIKYAREHVSDSDPSSARQALLVLGVEASPSDVALFEEMVKREDEAVSRAASNSLMRVCAIGEEQIGRLREELKNPAFRKDFERMWRDMQTLRSYKCANQPR